MVNDVSLTVRRGEVVGVAGVEGNGQAELVDAIIGTRHLASGSIEMLDEDITTQTGALSPRAWPRVHPPGSSPRGLAAGGTAVGERRRSAIRRRNRSVTVSGWTAMACATPPSTSVEAFDVRTPNIDVAAHALSGGNQQKLIVGREMSANPTMLIAAHPTRGIDVGAQAAVWDQLRAARAAGLATLLISADLDELIGLSDTIVVMLRGRLVATLDPAR